MPSSHFYSPRNPLAAAWASAAETSLRQRFPDMSVADIRRHPMMQGVYQHLRELGKKRRVQKPAAKTVPGTLTPEEAAYLSQHYFDMALTAAVVAPTGDPALYQACIAVIDTINDAAGIADFSTDDLLGFGLCLAVWLILVGQSSLNSMEEEFLEAFLAAMPYLSSQQKQEIQNAIASMHLQGASVQYRDASSYPGYGTIPWKIPSGARIVMLGDWGTALDDAHEFLYAIWKQALNGNAGTPVVFLHLGDIYYCGLPYECQHYFYDVFTAVGQRLAAEQGSGFNPNPPIFTLPGNHEYYSYGYGYFELLDGLNQNCKNPDGSTIPHSQLYQQCSFFNLQTQDGHWQFLGMDTGQADGNALLSALQAGGAFVEGIVDSLLPDWDWVKWLEGLAKSTYEDWVGPFQPTLRPNELSWHQNKLSNFSGKTIMLSHHQLFSREAEINHENPAYMNTWLRNQFSPYLNSKIAAWYWGHEHSFAVYLDGLMGLNKGRLLGSSSYEATQDNDTPYANNYPMIPFAPTMTDTLVSKNADGLYYHAGAILNPQGSSMQVKYYQFPAWTQLDTPPSNPQLQELTAVGETITTSFTSLSPSWIGNQPISQDKVTTDHNPAITAWNDVLYMLYVAKGDNNNASNCLALCTANVAGFAPESTSAKPSWSNSVTIQVNGSNLSTGNSPAVIAVNGTVYGFYVGSDKYIHGISLNTTSGSTSSWSSIGKMPTAVSAAGPAVCFFQGRIYVVYRQSGSSNNLCWAFYTIATNTWTDLGALKFGNTQFESPNIPALSADAFHMYMTYVQKDSNDHDIRWAVGTPSSAAPSGTSNNISWTDKQDITYTKGSSTSTPHTSIGMALAFNGNVFYLVYTADGDSDKLKDWALYGTGQNSTGSWIQGSTIQTKVNTSSPSLVQSSKAPSLAITSGGGFLVYRGNSHDEIYWAYY